MADALIQAPLHLSEILSEAEREISVWKVAYTTKESEITALRRELAQLKQAKTEVCHYVSPRHFA
jgi:hypothetical protein